MLSLFKGVARWAKARRPGRVARWARPSREYPGGQAHLASRA